MSSIVGDAKQQEAFHAGRRLILEHTIRFILEHNMQYIPVFVRSLLI